MGARSQADKLTLEQLESEAVDPHGAVLGAAPPGKEADAVRHAELALGHLVYPVPTKHTCGYKEVSAHTRTRAGTRLEIHLVIGSSL